MISALSWVPRGAMKRVPLSHDATPDEVTRARASARATDDSSDDEPLYSADDPAFASLAGVKLPPGFEEEEGGGSGAVAAGGADAAMADAADSDDDDASDVGDHVASAADAFVLVANTTDDFSNLEVYVYNEDDGNLYVRHDIMLPSFPLALAWADYAGDAAGAPLLRAGGAAPGGAGADSYVGSFCAVGTFDPAIELWCLDVVDPLEPTLVLPGSKKSSKKGQKRAGKGASASVGASVGGLAGNSAGATGDARSAGHADSVLGLGWNKAHRNLLASASADGTAKVWDIDGGGRVLHTYTHHKGKVQSVAWNPAETSVLATASYDLTASVTDARCPESNRIARYALTADPESLLWYPHNPAVLIASQADGAVVAYDCRSPDKALWRIAAHSAAVTSVAASSLSEGLIATSSLDKTVRLWDIGAAGGTADPILVSSKALAIGQVFSVSFFPDRPHLLAAGGSSGVLAIWDASEDAGDVTERAIAATPAGSVSGGSTIDTYFRGRRKSPESVPGFGIRPRSDGQPRV